MRLPKNTKKLHLTPYPGIVLVTKNYREFQVLAKKVFDMNEEREERVGRFLGGTTEEHGLIYLIWWSKYANLAHEMAHVVFDVFEFVGIKDASCGENEPFCYLLSQLITDTLE